jgi:hypothetical protein
MMRNHNTCYSNALNAALIRYNNQSLLLRFQRVTSGGNINIISGSGNYLAASGFPANGNPYPQITLNLSTLGTCPASGYLTTVLAHQLGHCIGFRHTDSADPSFSCGAGSYNDGSGSVGGTAIGFPHAPEPDSWMLTCLGAGQDRPFTADDQAALNYLH